MHKKISKLLVANRGEIALRVMKTAKLMGIKTVAVFSDADRNAPHVRYADEAYHIGEAPSKLSYLNIDKIIEVAKKSGANAIHPGYGFLSENANFALACEKEDIIFVGPSVNAIEIMGSKLASKQAVSVFNVPMVPGADKSVTSEKEASVIAEKIGYPVLIKASAGGGGKGMRVVEQPDMLGEQMQLAISEATSAFGDGSVFVEKFITSPRHVEIQVLGDTQGNIVYLFERECSIQRRHQKVVEEAPSSVLTAEKRKKMGEAAVKVAQSVQYTGAGTVEFILDHNHDFYFLEMNTRLQVEHPVTEMITGVDLVREQIRIAEGLPISFKQEDLKINGHALELRVYAEDPENNFLPDIGKLNVYKLPESSFIRVDGGVEEGMEIPIYYDPMLSKLIVHGSNRGDAIEKMIYAIKHYKIEGVKTTLPFGEFVMKHPAFLTGNFDTKFVEQYFHPNTYDENEVLAAVIAAALIHDGNNEENLVTESGNLSQHSRWLHNRA
jgi:acetyl-CoA carboxylase biotin carboxylase subunit